MKVYIVRAGTTGKLVTKDGRTQEHTNKNELLLDREEVIMDAVIRHNGDTVAWCKNMSQLGFCHDAINIILNYTGMLYIAFERNGYVWMVRANEVSIM